MAGLQDAGTGPVPAGAQRRLAKLIDEPFDDPDWVFEPKWDGVRTIAIVRRQGAERSVSLQSRNLNQANRQYPEIVEALYTTDLPDADLAGEIVAVDAEGRPRFQRLQQ